MFGFENSANSPGPPPFRPTVRTYFPAASKIRSSCGSEFATTIRPSLSRCVSETRLSSYGRSFASSPDSIPMLIRGRLSRMNGAWACSIGGRAAADSRVARAVVTTTAPASVLRREGPMLHVAPPERARQEAREHPRARLLRHDPLHHRVVEDEERELTGSGDHDRRCRALTELHRRHPEQDPILAIRADLQREGGRHDIGEPSLTGEVDTGEHPLGGSSHAHIELRTARCGVNDPKA